MILQYLIYVDDFACKHFETVPAPVERNSLVIINRRLFVVTFWVERLKICHGTNQPGKHWSSVANL